MFPIAVSYACLYEKLIAKEECLYNVQIAHQVCWFIYFVTPDIGLTHTHTYSTAADGRSCGLHCRSFGHAWLHS